MTETNNNYDIIIIGAGASGLLSACLLACTGKRILIIEKNKRIGMKLSATGNGRCNLTNLKMRWSNYYGDKEFIENIIDKVTPEDVIKTFESLGVYTREKDGYVYPHTNQAMTVVNALGNVCEKDNVTLFLETVVTDIIVNKDVEATDIIDVTYLVVTSGGKYGCEKLILACGGSAGAEQGGSTLGYDLVRELGHTVSNIYPGLTGMEAAGRWWKEVSGTRVQGSFSLFVDDMKEGTHTGEIQITAKGVSGIPVFQMCRIAAQALDEGKNVWGEIDFVPGMRSEEVSDWIRDYGIDGLVPAKWVPIVSKGDVVRNIKRFEFTITDTYSIEKAQVSAGGVPVDEISADTFESKLHEGVYLLGELLDVDGICGGYNLHLAWSSAIVAAEAIKSKGV
ncbi:MAG: aminoacetone oxidase family FAD-binding enzyme [Eubacterium sp.]|nr:aminoacetone oxidase family FAD-binding enzyme [Eubacterium sp.]